MEGVTGSIPVAPTTHKPLKEIGYLFPYAERI